MNHEIKKKTKLLKPNGQLIEKGYATRMNFIYNREYIKKFPFKLKEWDFYQVSDGKYMVQLSFANINIGGYVAAKLVDLVNGKEIIDCSQFFLGGNKHVPPAKGDVPNRYRDKIGKADFVVMKYLVGSSSKGRTVVIFSSPGIISILKLHSTTPLSFVGHLNHNVLSVSFVSKSKSALPILSL